MPAIAKCTAARSPSTMDRGIAEALLIIGPIVAGAVAAMWPCIDNSFSHVDDFINFRDNGRFIGLGLPQLAWAWRSMLLGVYQPIGWMFLSAQSSVWGIDPHGYHAVSVVLHAANAVALYYLTRSLLWRCIPGFGSSPVERLAAAASATLFAVHPLRVEVVAWASCQSYLLCAFFGQCSVLFYLGSHRLAPSKRASPALFASFGCFCAALLCKAPAVALPAVLVLLDIYPLRRLGGADGWFRSAEARRAWVEKVPYFALGIPLALFASQIRTNAGVMPPPPSFAGPLARIEHAAHSVSFYAWKTIRPFDLVCHYEVPNWATPASAFLLANLAAVSALTAFFVLGRRSRPGLLAAWVGYLLLLAPNSGLVPFGNYFAADRYSYLPMMAWAPPVAASLAAVWRSRPRIMKGVVAFGVSVALLSWIVLSRDQCRPWYDQESLWRHALAQGPGSNWVVHNNLGTVLFARGSSLEEALAHYTEAARLNPNDMVLINRAHTLSELKRADEAVEQYRAVIDREPGSADLRIGFARLLAIHGRQDDAIVQYLAAIEIDPDAMDARLGLARSLLECGKIAEAVRQLQEASRRAPGLTDIHVQLGSALALGGESDQAANQFREALKIDPQHAGARVALDRLKRTINSSRADY
jgi:tetratricopeptide (TPR) repeat protein